MDREIGSGEWIGRMDREKHPKGQDEACWVLGKDSNMMMRHGHYIALSELAPIHGLRWSDPSVGWVGNARCIRWPLGSRPACALCLSMFQQCWRGTPSWRPPGRF